MPQVLRAKLKATHRAVQIEITKENYEAFCDAIGLYQKEFLQALNASERDHQAKRITKRKSLHELMS